MLVNGSSWTENLGSLQNLLISVEGAFKRFYLSSVAVRNSGFTIFAD